jgi:hypothetical protein
VREARPPSHIIITIIIIITIPHRVLFFYFFYESVSFRTEKKLPIFSITNKKARGATFDFIIFFLAGKSVF